MENKIIGMAADHAGYELKEALKQMLTSMGYTIRDFGTHPLAEAVENHSVDFGIAMCGSGNGISMTLNKHQGIRAALCWKPELGSLAKQHNNANILTLPARFITEPEAEEIVKAYISASFEGGRHQRRIDKIPCK